MKISFKKICCLTIAIFLCLVSLPFDTTTAYAAEDSFALFDDLQAITWNEESLAVIQNDPDISKNVSIARADRQLASGGYEQWWHFSCLGKYYYNGAIGEDSWSGSTYINSSDISQKKFPIQQPVIAFKFSGNDANSNMYWIVCPFTTERWQSDPFTGQLCGDANEALVKAQENAKKYHYKKCLEKYLSADAANAFEAAYTNYFTNTTDEANNAADSTEQTKKKNVAESTAQIKKKNTILSTLGKLTFSEALFNDSEVMSYLTDYEIPHEEDGKYCFKKDGNYIVACSLLHAEGTSLLEFHASKDRAAIKLNGVSLYDDGIDYWYIVKYSKAGINSSTKKFVIESLKSISAKTQKSDAAKEAVLDSIDEASGLPVDDSGVPEETSAPITYEEALLEDFVKISFHVNPLDELKGLDFDSDENVGLVKLKSTAASFYKFISLIATVGMVISLFLMSVKMMVGGRREAKASIINIIYKFVIFACICGFVNLWALFYPIVQSLT